MKKIIQKIAVSALVVSSIFSLSACKSSKYDEAKDLFHEGKYDDAQVIFEELDGYEDSKEYLDRMGWCKFYSYIKNQGGVKLTCRDNLASYDIMLNIVGDTIEAKYSIGKEPEEGQLSVDSTVKCSALLKEHKEKVKLEMYGATCALTSICKDKGSAMWDISKYTFDGETPEWDEYDTECSYFDINGKRCDYPVDIWGNPIDDFKPIYLCDSPNAKALTLKRLVSGIKEAVIASGLDTTMADLGFNSLED